MEVLSGRSGKVRRGKGVKGQMRSGELMEVMGGQWRLWRSGEVRGDKGNLLEVMGGWGGQRGC